jgi:hypothetical protein
VKEKVREYGMQEKRLKRKPERMECKRKGERESQRGWNARGKVKEKARDDRMQEKR